MSTASSDTRVEVGVGLLARRAASLAAARGAALVTDRHVEPLLPPALAALPRHVLEPGEAHKDWHALGRLLEALDVAGLDRDGHVVAVGGGVVTDLAGLAAALHRRGVAWTAIPTTLVGQVDAALGGKTAVNLAGGKNTVGTVHPPREVLVDPGLLATLPAVELRCGLAEVLKTALLDGEALLARVERLSATDVAAARPEAVAVIEACLHRKQALVREDLHDRGPRRLLNLGHTFGHAFEAASRGALRHGEAVGLGLLCAARLGASRGGEADLEARLRAALSGWGLPVATDVDAQALPAQFRRDKKRRGGRNVYVLPRAPGRVDLVADVTDDEVLRALGAVLRSASTS